MTPPTCGDSLLKGAKSAILINPPVYDTQYWAYWSQPHGLLKVATWLRRHGYERLRLVDCLATDSKRRVKHRHKIPIVRDNVTKQMWEFGMSLAELRQILKDTQRPDEIWITSIMTYWWESTRDVVDLIKEVYPYDTPRVLVGGIYPTLFPEHARANLGKQANVDVVVVEGEIDNEAANSWTDLSLYTTDSLYPVKPRFALITGSRGCPFNCAYCAQSKLNRGKKDVTPRPPEDIADEMEQKYVDFRIREFAFYEDNLLFKRDDFLARLRAIRDRGLKVTLYAPEGIEPRLVDLELLREMRATGFRRLHLALETIDDALARKWNRNQATIEKFEHAVEVAHQAGWTTESQALNAFVMFGLPDEDLQKTVDTALYVSQRLGSVIPMLFTPVPGSRLFETHKEYLFTQVTAEGKRWGLQHLNGKLLPFLEYNRTQYRWLRATDYLNLESFMMHLNNSKVHRLPFNFAAENEVARAFRAVLSDANLVSAALPANAMNTDTCA